MALQDEDFEDYSDEEGFVEDSLNDEEYDKLYATLPSLKEQISSYNSTIDDLKLKEALYYNYYEIEPALEELKAKFPRKKRTYRSIAGSIQKCPSRCGGVSRPPKSG